MLAKLGPCFWTQTASATINDMKAHPSSTRPEARPRRWWASCPRSSMSAAEWKTSTIIAPFQSCNDSIYSYSIEMFKWRKHLGEASPLIFLKKKVRSPVPLQSKNRTKKQWVKSRLDPIQPWQMRCRVETLRFQRVVLTYFIRIFCLSCPILLPHMLDHSCGNIVHTLDRTSMPFHCLLTCSRSNTDKLLLILQLEEHR